MVLYWTIIAAQEDDSHQSQCNRLTSCVNVFPRDLALKRTVCFAGNEATKASEYTDLGRVTEFKYGVELGNALRGNNPIRFLQNFGMSKTYSLFPVSIKFVIENLTTDKQILMAKYFKRCV